MKDKSIDITLLLINLGVLLLPLIIALFFSVNFIHFFTEEYIYGSTINKFSISLLFSAIFMLRFQSVSKNEKKFWTWRKWVIKQIFRWLFFALSIGALIVVSVCDTVMMVVSFGGKPPNLNLYLSIIVTAVGFMFALIVNCFCIFSLKKYDILK